MDPISIALGVVGLGMQIFGGAKQSSDVKQGSQQIAAISQDEARQEQAISDAKQRAMEMDASRQQLQIIRNAQRARALAEATGVNQGAQFGSGVPGGLAQISGQSEFNLAGVNQGLLTGREIAGYNRNISSDRIQMAGVRSKLASDTATDQGYQSLGGALLKSGPLIGPIFKGFGFGGGSNSTDSSGNY